MRIVKHTQQRAFCPIHRDRVCVCVCVNLMQRIKRHDTEELLHDDAETVDDVDGRAEVDDAHYNHKHTLHTIHTIIIIIIKKRKKKRRRKP